MKVTTKKLSSLDKVFPDTEPAVACEPAGSVLRNEPFAFQIAWRAEQGDGESYMPGKLQVKAAEDFDGAVRLYAVGLVPSELPAYSETDDDYLTTQPGLFPDPLYPLLDSLVKAVPGQWRSIWVELDPKEALPAGSYDIRILFTDEEGGELAFAAHTIEVLEAELPKQELIHTEWFHYDCLANRYGAGEFDDAHWTLIERYVRTAVEHGMNMLLTPLFTPPLDTQIGGERPTMQLVGVTVTDEGYAFDFTRLKRFVDLALKLGIEHLELAHLFTQWGAIAAPKIEADTAEGRRRIFGWETEGTGEAYKSFLDQFLPALVRKLRDWGVADRCWFHISDEPNLRHLDNYRSARAIVEPHIQGFRTIDALSDYAFFQEGLVETPVPGSDHIKSFLEAGVSPLWTYYCCAQYRGVANRFMAMPSRRSRIIAGQWYKYRIEGFLHWGYNFWNTQFSLKAIDPYAVTDAGNAFPSGDAFLVYPGDDGSPVASIRLKVLREALNDLRAMQLLERLASRELVMEILEAGVRPITFADYPRDDAYIPAMRARINDEISKRWETRDVKSP